MIILVDTGAWYALADDSDRNAESARTYFRKNLDAVHWATTHAVLFESWRLIQYKLGWDAALRFLENLRRSTVRLLPVEPEDVEAAWRILNAYADQELSLVDAVSFSVMERYGITEAFTFDKDFLMYRFGPKGRRSFHCVP